MKNPERVGCSELVRLAAQCTGQDIEAVNKVVDSLQDEIYRATKRGQSVTLKGFGGFFVRPERESWVFKFNPCQNMAAHFMRTLFGWSSTYKGEI